MATPQEPSAVGVYDDLDAAERTIDELRRAGFTSEEVGIIGHMGQTQTVPTPPETHSPEGNAINGFVRGAIIGAIAGGFVILVIPGLGAVAGMGRWFEILGGALLGAGICGVMIAFSSLIFMRPSTRLYAQALDKGQFIVTVKNPARKEEAANLLRQSRAGGASPPN